MTVQLLIRAQCVGVPQHRDAQKETERGRAVQYSTHLGQMMLRGEPQPVHRVGAAISPLPKLLRCLREAHVRGDGAVYYSLRAITEKNVILHKPQRTSKRDSTGGEVRGQGAFEAQGVVDGVIMRIPYRAYLSTSPVAEHGLDANLRDEAHQSGVALI